MSSPGTHTAIGFRHPDLSGIKVLIVDDEVDARELVKQCWQIVTQKC